MTNEVKRRLICHWSLVIGHFEIWKKRMNSAKWWCLVLFLVFSSSSGSAQIASRPADEWIPLLESPDRVANLAERIRNIRTVPAAPEDPKIPDKVDLIFLCDTLHHIAGPDKYLTKLPAYLKPGGRVAVIDFRENWPPGHEAMKFTAEQLQSWMAAAGFKKVEDLSIPKNAFFHIYAPK